MTLRRRRVEFTRSSARQPVRRTGGVGSGSMKLTGVLRGPGPFPALFAKTSQLEMASDLSPACGLPLQWLATRRSPVVRRTVLLACDSGCPRLKDGFSEADT